MKNLITIVFSLLLLSGYAQTWADDVATIMYNKCTKCHHTGGAGPFPLMTFAEASPMASAIETAVSGDVMPPWPPDNNYQQYVHDRSLTPTEKVTILDWILNGAPEGNPANTPPPPVYTPGAVLGNGDLEVQIPTYMSKATTEDDYVCFAIPSNLATTRTIKAIEILPGNTEIVHHALVYVDPNANNVTDTIGGDCAGPSSSTATLAMGYTPGSSPMVLPSVPPLKLGMPMPAGSQILLAMHYPAGSYGMYDSTKVIFHFYPPGETGIRDVTAAAVLQNWSFSLPPNQVTQVNAQYPGAGGLPANISLLSVFPHMHLLGKSMRVFGIEPSLDTLKLSYIPDWDFEWQDFYFFKNMQKATFGTTLKVEAIYDNTTGNPNNPNNPTPITVTAGLNTTDEMCLVYFHYMLYQPGDENYDMDSLLNQSMNDIVEQNLEEGAFSIFPNPFTDNISIYNDGMNPGDVVSLYIYDQQGQLIKRLANTEVVSSNELLLHWDGRNEEGADVSPGMYHLSIIRNGVPAHQRIVKQ